MARTKAAGSTRSRSKTTGASLVAWPVTYFWNEGILASRTVAATTKEDAREIADRLVPPKKRIMADKVEITRAE
jgi:hypothetical protein